MSLDCGVVRAELERLVDGGRDYALASDLLEHVAGCARCREQHVEAASLPSRVRALRSPLPPAGLVAGVMAQISARPRAVVVWLPFVPEGLLVLVAAWYASASGGLGGVFQRTVSDVSSFLSWGAGQASAPASTGGDLFLLLLATLLAGVALWHLVLLTRQPFNPQPATGA